MKHNKTSLIALILFIAFTNSAKAQFANNLANGNLVIGIGWNVVDDNGQKFENLFDMEGSWNLLTYPTVLRVEKGFTEAASFVFSGSYNKYENSKIINNDIQTESSSFYAFDFGIKYNFVSSSEVFDIYGVIGGGATHRATSSVGNEATANLSIGMNVYLYKGLGINIDAASKFGVEDFWKTGSNYTQYSMGLIYKANSSKKYYGESNMKFN